MNQVTGLRRPLTKMANPDAAIRGDALNDIMTVGGLGLAGGIGLRGLMGLRYMFGRSRPNLSRSLGPTVISVPTPVFTNPRDEARAQAQAQKMSSDKAAIASRSELPFYLPGMTMAGIGGLAGGYKLMDLLMGNKRRTDLNDEVAAARDEYRQALLAQYDPANVPAAGSVPDAPLPAKTVNHPPAGASKLPLKMASLDQDLDALCGEVEKVAIEKQAIPGWMGKGLGVYGTLASLLALGSGVAAYNVTKSRSPNKLMEDAIKARERQRWASRPPEIYAIPTPVRLNRGGGLTQTAPTPTLPGAEESEAM
jgi:hypothetical protein